MKTEVTAAIAIAAVGVSAQAGYPPMSSVMASPPPYNPLSASKSAASSAPSMMAPMMPSMMTSMVPTSAPSMSSMSTITVDVWESCTDTGIVTETQAVTVTLCPLCTETPAPAGPVHTTVYTTYYDSICSTGPTKQRYVVTETCTDEKPTWSAGPDYVPQGFTETVTVCTVCGKKPVTTTLTVPCDSTPAPAPAMPTATPNGAAPNGATPNSAPPYPMGGNMTKPMCPGPQCQMPGSMGGSANPTSGPAGGAGGAGGAGASASSSGPMPYTPGANAAAGSSMDLAFVIAVFGVFAGGALLL